VAVSSIVKINKILTVAQGGGDVLRRESGQHPKHPYPDQEGKDTRVHHRFKGRIFPFRVRQGRMVFKNKFI
jgi:hypothetical protein